MAAILSKPQSLCWWHDWLHSRKEEVYSEASKALRVNKNVEKPAYPVNGETPEEKKLPEFTAMVKYIYEKVGVEPGPIFYLWPSMVLANKRRHYLCNIFSYWLRPC